MKKFLKKLLSWQVIVAGLILALIGWGISMCCTVVYGLPAHDFGKEKRFYPDTQELQPDVNRDSVNIRARSTVYGPNPNLKRHD